MSAPVHWRFRRRMELFREEKSAQSAPQFESSGENLFINCVDFARRHEAAPRLILWLGLMLAGRSADFIFLHFEVKRFS